MRIEGVAHSCCSGRGADPGVSWVRQAGWLQAFANNQPVTFVGNTMRALALGGPLEPNLWKSVAWLAGIFIVFAPLAVRAYKRAA